ncbi:MAG TPA: helix-turn-helix transcriptional regulator [Chitinophagaceae bacterium]|jgi:Helix-turn-helix.
MKTIITKKSFETSEIKINELLAIATQKGGFDNLTKKEKAALDKYTQVVKAYEDVNYKIPLPQTVQGLIELKMYEKKLKQKELARMLNVTDTKLSEIMHNKRKPSLSFIKAMNEVLGIDGNLLLKIA